MNGHGRGRGPMGMLALLVLGLLGLLGLPLAGTSSAATVVTPEIHWSKSVGLVRESSPAVADVDGDGRLDIAFGDHDGRLWVLGPDGNVLTGWPQGVGADIDSSPAVADTDTDGRAELFVGVGTHESHRDRTGGLVSYRAGGARRFFFDARDNDFDRPSVHSSPAIGDIAGSATLDVAFGSLSVKSIWALEQDGVAHRGFPYYADDTVFSSPALVDVDGDGRRDLVIGGDSAPGPPVDHRGGMVRAIRGDGHLLWEYRIDDMVRGGPSVGDITGDGRPEIVFGAGDFYGGADSVKVFAVDLQGRNVPGWPKTTDGVTNASPTLADLDGNGRLDVVVGTWGSTHGRGKGGTLYAWNGAGQDLDGYPLRPDGGVMLGSPTTVDLDGDGHQDPIVATGGGIYAYGGDSGELRFRLLVGRMSFQNSVAVADVDGNGRLDLLAAGGLDGAGMAYRWELPASAELGVRGWHQFRKDSFHTGTWTSTIPPSRAMEVERLQGDDRAATAARVATADVTGAETVILATGAGPADALAAGPAAAIGDGVVLLSNRDTLPSPTRAAIADLRPRTVLVLGGTGAISEATLAEVESVVPGADVRRVSGTNRYDTAAQLSTSTFTDPAVAYVASGEGYADALAGGAAAALESAPILLVHPGSVPPETAAAIAELAPDRLVVLGGEGSISPLVFNQLRALVPNTVRRAGPDRWSTATAISASLHETVASPMLASGEGFADALAAAPVAARRRVPLLLTKGGCVPLATRFEIERLGATRLTLVGGSKALLPTIGALTPCP